MNACDCQSDSAPPAPPPLCRLLLVTSDAQGSATGTAASATAESLAAAGEGESALPAGRARTLADQLGTTLLLLVLWLWCSSPHSKQELTPAATVPLLLIAGTEVGTAHATGLALDGTVTTRGAVQGATSGLASGTTEGTASGSAATSDSVGGLVGAWSMLGAGSTQ